MGSIPATAPYPASARLHLRLLGRFELSRAQCPLQARPSGERLLAYLAVTPGPVARQDTAAPLWPDCTEVRAAAEPVSISTLPQDVLPGWPEHWLVPTREWVRQVRLRALEALCDRHRAAGRTGSALGAALAAVGCDPLRESAHRRLALSPISEGNLAEALRQYHVYRQLARSQLGLRPSAQFRQIIAPLPGRPADVSAG